MYSGQVQHDFSVMDQILVIITILVPSICQCVIFVWSEKVMFSFVWEKVLCVYINVHTELSKMLFFVQVFCTQLLQRNGFSSGLSPGWQTRVILHSLVLFADKKMRRLQFPNPHSAAASIPDEIKPVWNIFTWPVLVMSPLDGCQRY